jgi:Tfp pilus assembly protein PilO
MDKFLNMGWGDFIKVVIIIATVATAWGIQQAKISDLQHGREENRAKIETLSERIRLQEIYIASIKEQTTQIQSDVTVIKNYLINSGLNHR